MKTITITGAAWEQVSAAAEQLGMNLDPSPTRLPDGRVQAEVDDDVYEALAQLDADPSAAIGILVRGGARRQ